MREQTITTNEAQDILEGVAPNPESAMEDVDQLALAYLDDDQGQEAEPDNGKEMAKVPADVLKEYTDAVASFAHGCAMVGISEDDMLGALSYGDGALNVDHARLSDLILQLVLERKRSEAEQDNENNSDKGETKPLRDVVEGIKGKETLLVMERLLGALSNLAEYVNQYDQSQDRISTLTARVKTLEKELKERPEITVTHLMVGQGEGAGDSAMIARALANACT